MSRCFETLAGIERVRSSAQHAAAVYCVTINPLSRPDSYAKNGGKSLNVSRADKIHSTRRSAIPAMWQSAIRSSSIAIASGMPWKLPPETMSFVLENTSGLSVTAPSSAVRIPLTLAIASIAAPRDLRSAPETVWILDSWIALCV